MSKDYVQYTNELSESLKKLRGEAPEVAKGFSSLAAAATSNGALDKKTKELIAIGISVAKRCDGCIGFHSKTLVNLNCTREEFIEALGMAVYLGGGPSFMYAADALEAYDQFSKEKAGG